MSTNDKEKPNNDNNDLDRLARQMLLEEAKRNKIRAETQGALGWKKPTTVTNRKFLRNTLISNAVHNIHKNEQEKQQRIQGHIERKHDDYKYHRKRSRSPSSSSTSTKTKRDYNDDELSSKRTKQKDK